jgi:glycosyltransferase involved in cell wall biosynthesis
MLYGVTLVKDVVDRARRVLVHSPAARDMIVRVRPERAADIRVVPYAIPARPHLDGMRDEPLVATFGFVKHGRLFIEAAARVAAQLPDARFMFAGRVQEPHVESRLTALIRARGLEDRFLVHHGRQIGPWLPDQLYYRLLSRTMVAVQLREYFYGETSGSTRRDCLSAGIPTIVNRVGTQAELPESVVLHVSPRPSPDEVANAVIRLLRDRSLRKALSRAALRFAADHTFAKEAKAVLAAVTD